MSPQETAFLPACAFYGQLLLAELQLALSPGKPQVWDLEILSKAPMRMDHIFGRRAL